MRTTKKDFDYFKACANEWINTLGLREWSIHFYHGQCGETYAQTQMNTGGMVATITMSTYWDDLREKTEEQINRLAFHEVLHLLMCPLISEAQERYTTNNTLTAIEHSIIRRLENVIL